MRSAGIHNPLGILSDEAVAAGELDNVIGLITAYDSENPCLEYANPLQCASDPWPYLAPHAFRYKTLQIFEVAKKRKTGLQFF